MMSVNTGDVKSRFDLWFYELEPICKTENPWGFLCMAALLDYLSKLANGTTGGKKEYVQFMRDYFPSQYKYFSYRGGQQDLPEQMYHVLRCGLVHSFSLISDPIAKAKGGRDRSIVLIHASAAKEAGLSHLDNFVGSDGSLDAALFVAETLLDDLKTAAYDLLNKATAGSQLEANILNWFTSYPPIRGQP